MILVDTSVWIDYLRRGDAALSRLLGESLVAMHPFVIGELACGKLANRDRVLGLLANLPAVPIASHHEAMSFIDSRRLMGSGVGYVDAHLLASAALSGGTKIWTHDRALARVSTNLNLAAPSRPSAGRAQ